MAILSPGEEKDLLFKVSAGDEKAFRNLFDQYWDNIYGVALVFTKSIPLAEEMVQDVFLKVWQKKNQLPSISNFEGWLFTVARNHIFNELRKKIKEQSFTNELLEYFEASASTPEQLLDLKKSEELINKGLEQLPGQQKKIFMLSRKEGKSQEEIAAILGLSRLTVKTHMHHALRNLRKYLRTHSDDTLFLIAIILLYLPVNQ